MKKIICCSDGTWNKADQGYLAKLNSLKSNGEQNLGNYIKLKSLPNDNYSPDYNSGETLYSGQILGSYSNNTNYIKIASPVTYQATVQLPSGVQLKSLLGCRVEFNSGNYEIKYTDNSSVCTTKCTEGNSNSGLTLMAGFDMYASKVPIFSSDTTIFTIDFFLRACCDNWKNTDMFGPQISDINNISTERQIVLNIAQKKGQDAMNYWVKNRRLFELLDLNNSFTGYGNYIRALNALIPFMNNNYYKGALSSLQKKGLKTTPNVIEKYLILANSYNLPKTLLFSSKYKNRIIEAINEHNLEKLQKVFIDESVNNFKNKLVVLALLNSNGVKAYYTQFQEG